MTFLTVHGWSRAALHISSHSINQWCMLASNTLMPLQPKSAAVKSSQDEGMISPNESRNTAVVGDWQWGKEWNMGNVLMQLLQLALHRDDTSGLVSTTLKFLHPYYSLTSKLHSVLPTGKKKWHMPPHRMTVTTMEPKCYISFAFLKVTVWLHWHLVKSGLHTSHLFNRSVTHFMTLRLIEGAWRYMTHRTMPKLLLGYLFHGH